MPVVIGAFTTLGEAERATGALLESGFAPAAMTALARTGGGRLLLAGRVAVHRVGEPAQLVNRTQQQGAAAIAAGLAGGIVAFVAVVILPRLGAQIPVLSDPAWGTAPAVLALILGAALVCGALGALLRGLTGLPNDLAVRYGVFLDQGDTVLAVATTAGAQARAARETMALHGAVQTHVTRGTLAAAEVPDEAPYAPGVN
jgi:hypothetical protein